MKNLLDNHKQTHINFTLDNITQVLNKLDNPQNFYKTIHITGTNGKGSVAAFLETGLHCAQYNIGKFTSPHIKSINENIQYNKTPISDIEID